MGIINKKNLSTFLLVFAIFIVALFLRTIKLSEYPVGFQIDEASLGYNGYSLLMTGKSDEGNFLPLYVNIFGDERPAGYHYLTILPVKLFGLTEFATRIPGAVFGALMVFPFFLISYLLFQKKKIAIIAAVLLTISPWGVVLSRASAETIVALFFILSGFYLVFDSVGRKSNTRLIYGTILLAVSFFFYHTPRVFVPLCFIMFLIVLYWPIHKVADIKKYLNYLLAFIFLSVVSFSLVFLVKGGTGRFSQVNIFGFPETKLVLQEEIREDGTAHAPLILTRIFHNKIINYSLTYTSNYFSYFTGDFLFVSGGLPIWYRVDKVGLILLIEFPFVLYGAFIAIRSKNKFAKLPLLWILVAPATAAFTVDDVPNLQRAIVLFPMLELLAAVGIVGMLDEVKRYKKIVTVVLGVLILFNFAYFLNQYFVQGKVHRPWYRNNGFGAMMKIVNSNYNSIDHIVMTKNGGGYPLVLFYSKFSPAEYQKDGSPRDADYKGFGKFIFVPQDCPSINTSVKLPLNSKTLYVDMGTCKIVKPKGSTIVTQTVNREDGTPAFRVVHR